MPPDDDDDNVGDNGDVGDAFADEVIVAVRFDVAPLLFAIVIGVVVVVASADFDNSSATVLNNLFVREICFCLIDWSKTRKKKHHHTLHCTLWHAIQLLESDSPIEIKTKKIVKPKKIQIIEQLLIVYFLWIGTFTCHQFSLCSTARQKKKTNYYYFDKRRKLRDITVGERERLLEQPIALSIDCEQT